MLKIILRAFSSPGGDTDPVRSWWRDPLSHPDIARMDQRQIADLPMPKLPVPIYQKQECAQRNGASRGGSASTSKCSGANPARARAAICS